MAVKSKAEFETGTFSKLWLLYFIFTIALIGATLAYLVTLPLYFLGRLYPPVAALADRTLCAGIYFLMAVQPWLNARIDLKTQFDPTPVSKGRLLVSNHRSHLDAFLLLSRIPGIRILAKSSLFQIPFLGLMMRLSQQISVKRGRLDAFFAAMDDVRLRLRRGQTVHIFPEMTRCDPGHQGTLNFSTAPFLVALQEKVTIIPVVFKATDNVWPKGKFGLSFRFPIEVFSLEPLDVNQFTCADDIRTEARRRIEEALK